MPSHVPRRRSAGVAAMTLTAALALTACGSDGEQNVPGENLATVTGGGHNYTFDDDTPRSDYPNPCSFIPASSASALLGGPVTANRGALLCSYRAQLAVLPGLTVQLRWIGADAGVKYAYAVSVGSRGEQVRSGVPGVSPDAVLSQDGRVVRIDALVANVYFRVQATAVTTRAEDRDDALDIVRRAARLVAGQLG